MLLEDLFEGPYLIGQEYKPTIKVDWRPSLAALHREFIHLGEITFSSDEIFNFWISSNNSFAIITAPAIDPLDRDAGIRQLVVSKISFDNRANLPVPKELQVDTVYTHPTYRTKFLGGILYILLARYGYSVVSDFSQYLGRQSLWGKIAKKAEGRNYSVFIWSDENSDWIREANGEPIKYNAANIADEKIWQDISEHHLSTTLFCLQHGNNLKEV